MNLGAYSMMFSTKLLPLIYALIGFAFLIIIHEFGHFLFAKIFGIRTPTFSIGFGPTIIEKKIGGTKFRIAPIPLGGYVEITGLAEVGQGEQKEAKSKDKGSFATKPYWQKLCVLSGGVLFNMIFAYLAFATLFFIGMPKQKVEVFINSNIDKSVSEKYGLKAGDQIVSVNNKTLSQDYEKLQEEINQGIIGPMKHNSKVHIKLGILRDHKTINLNIRSKSKEITDKLRTAFVPKISQVKGEYEKYSLIDAISKGIKVTNQWTGQIIYGIKYLITKRTLKGAGGPIMIISKTFEIAQKGIIPLIVFLAIISINLAIINIFPLGALDGGQLLFASIEAIIRRETPEIVRLVINLSSWVLLLGLILYLSYQDILTLFTGN